MSSLGSPGTGAAATADSPQIMSPYQRFAAFPEKAGLYDPANEHENCGMAAVATLRGTPGHDIVDHALVALRNLEHRGAVGGDVGTGDGAGLLTQIPDEFFRAVTEFELPPMGQYLAGTAFLPQSPAQRETMCASFGELAEEQGLIVLGWRDVPVDASMIGSLAKESMPYFRQVFLGFAAEDSIAYQESASGTLDQRGWRLRKRGQNRLGVYFPSLSSKTITYKGMLTTAQLEPFFPDLSDERYKTTLGIVHSRFSTNTFPSWPLAQPLRNIAHNGEINTVKGNRNWMRARQSVMASELFGEDPESLFPICTPGASDSTSFDEAAELLMLSGRPLAQSMRMMIPEAWENHETMDPDLRAFYQYHAQLMEAWDGPAAIAFTDGQQVGAMLDRNGLRPARYWVTDDGLVVMSSEVGVLDLEPSSIVRKGRVAPGMMLLLDTVEGRIIEDEEIKADLASSAPWADWVQENLVKLGDLPERLHVRHPSESVRLRQQTFGYTHEELRVLIGPMATAGAEPLGAMGTDTPIAVLADRPRLIFDYFVQTFAQVTNPPLDAIREELVTSLGLHIGPSGNLLSNEQVRSRQVALDFPVINNDELAKIANIRNDDGAKIALKVRALYRAGSREEELRQRIREICEKVSAAVNRGVSYIVISDRDSNAQWAPIPSLLMLSAIHHHLLKSANRTKVSLVVEAGDVREVHHVACLIGYGAAAVNPYLAMETAEDMVRRGELTAVDEEQAVHNLLTALGKGVLKIMSKMGISTVASYCGAQTFEAVGLAQNVVDQYFSGTHSPMGGVGLNVLSDETLERHSHAYPADGNDLGRGNELEIGG
ncbi:glutamate synthase subunit alpha, partial [Nesterenkonia sp. E16_10]